MAIFTVTNGLDSGVGSLRQAVLDSNATPGANIINFDPSVSIVTLTTDGLAVTNSVTINGLGSSLLEVTRDLLAPSFRIWQYSGNITFVLNGMKISNGFYLGAEGGAGLASYTTLNDVFSGDDLFFYNCRSQFGSGGAVRIDSGSKVTTFTNLRVEQCSQGGSNTYGVRFTDNVGGSGGSVNITNAVFTNNDNTGNNGGAIAIDGPLNGTFQNIEIYNNITSSGPQGISVINADSNTIYVDNTYIHDNTYSTPGPNRSSIFMSAMFASISNTEIYNNLSSGGIIVSVCPMCNITNTNVYGLEDTALALLTSSVFVKNCQFYNNNVFASTNRFVGGINVDFGSTLQLTDSTVYGNVAQQAGGIRVVDSGSNINILNTTISGNTSTDATGAGGIYFINAGSTNSLTCSTIANNISTGGAVGGVLQTAGTITVTNTIIATNSGSLANDVSGTFTSLGSNLIGDGTGSVSFVNGVNGDQVGTTLAPIDPLLGPLSNNGGVTLTMALLPGSPAIDTGNVATNPVGNIYDQRGSPFLRVRGSGLDIGAYETQAIICYSGDSLVRVKEINTGIVSDIAARDVTSDKYLVYNVLTKQFVSIVYNIKAGTTDKFKLIRKNLFAPSEPSSDFYVTEGHMILYRGKYLKSRDIPGSIDAKIDKQIVYSICTEKSIPIMINGIGVLTWGKAKWADYSTKNFISWTSQ